MNITLAQRHYEQALEFERQLAKIAIEVGEPVEPMPSAKRASGDPFALRGLPDVGVKGGLCGAIRGTIPHAR